MNSQTMYSNSDTRNYTQPRRRMSNPFCKVCYQSGCSPEQYNSHYVRENPAPTSKVVCPTLLSLKCNYCRNTGHTISHCTLLADKKKCNSQDGLKKHVIDERYKRIHTSNIGDIGDINNHRQYPIIATPETARRQTMVTVTTAPLIHDNELYGMTQEQIEETLREEEMLDDIERMMKEEDIHYERVGNPHHYTSSTAQHPTYYDNIPLYRQDDSFIPIQENHTDYYEPTAAVCGDDTYYARKRRRIVIPTATKFSSSMDNYIETNFNQQVNNLSYDFQMEVDDSYNYDSDQMDVDDSDHDDDLMEVDDNGSVS